MWSSRHSVSRAESGCSCSAAPIRSIQTNILGFADSIMNYQGHYAGAPSQPSSTDLVDTSIEIHYFLVKANPNIDPPGFVGYYTLACSLPPGGAVLSYLSGEFAETTDYGE